jgi:hypothetical protein
LGDSLEILEVHSSGTTTSGQQGTDEHANPSSDGQRQQRPLPHGPFNLGAQGGVEIIQQLLKLLLKGLKRVRKTAHALTWLMHQVFQLLLHGLNRTIALGGNQVHNLIETAPGGL